MVKLLPPTMKLYCKFCQTFKEHTEFARNGKAGRYSKCKRCKVDYQREYEKTGASRRWIADRLRRLGNKCELCRTPLGPKFCVDHDHSTGKKRGLLCYKCNMGLGYFNDSPEELRRAARYIEHFQE